ncbi:MAG TPA: hypothetical protein VLD63_09720 [Anaerolineales bacterium]|nr:hypothetical protein [Anaerolineales bacterium]
MPSPSISPRETYWSSFAVQDEDLDFLSNLLIEREAPLTTAELAAALVERRLERLASAARRDEVESIAVYRPADSYAEGARLRFPALGDTVGTVVGLRPGSNPDLGPFQVVKVKFSNGGGTREFASALESHALNAPAAAAVAEEAQETSASVLKRHGHVIEEELTRRLNQAPDIVRIAGRWFPKALLAEIHEGHLNLAEAVLDVAGGGPLPTSQLLAHVELPQGLDPLLAEFSLDYALQEDERFDEVGPAGKVLWFMRRLEPPDVLSTPLRLEPVAAVEDRSRWTPELTALEQELDDELSPVADPEESSDEVVLPLLYPHWRAGTLPLSSRLRPLFPTAYEAPRIRFILVDGHSGDKFPGWVVRTPRYVYGLGEWYRRYDIPVGGLVRIRPGSEAGEVVVEAVERRRRTEWIRTAVVRPDGQVGFTMLKQAVGTSFDERMIVGVVDPEALEQSWMRGSQRRLTVDRLVQQVFLELAKLNPQSAVHAQLEYSGVNVLQRLSPAAVFTQMVEGGRYTHVGDLYYRAAEGTVESG